MKLIERMQCSNRLAMRVFSFLAILSLVVLLWPVRASAQYVHVRLDTDGSVGRLYGDFMLSPDGVYVLYRKHGAPLIELYSVPIAGGEPILLNQGHGASLYRYEISPDSKWVVYEDVMPLSELWVVSITGGVSIPLASPGNSIFNFAISPDSRHVVYTQPPNMYSVPITGGTPTLLTLPPAGQRRSGKDIYFEISPDSTLVAFQEHGTFDAEKDRQIRSYTVPITGGTPEQVESPPGPHIWERFAITADSRRVVVERFIDGLLFSVYSFPVEGGATVGLSDDFEVKLSSHNLLSRRMELLPMSVDPPRIFYQHWDAANRLGTIVTVPAGGGDVTLLASGEGPTQALHPITLTDDGKRLIYSGEDYRGMILYSTPITSSSPVQLTPALDFRSEIEIAPDGSQVVYVTEVEVEDGDDIYTLYRVPVNGGDPVKIIRQRGQIDDVGISPDGGRILFRSEAESAGGWYIVPMLGSSPELIPGLSNGEFTPDGTRIVYAKSDGLFVCFKGHGTYLPYVSYPPPMNTNGPRSASFQR